MAAGFVATMTESDFSGSCIIGFDSSSSRCGPGGVRPQAKPETSRFPRKELPHMPGSSTTPGRTGPGDLMQQFGRQEVAGRVVCIGQRFFRHPDPPDDHGAVVQTSATRPLFCARLSDVASSAIERLAPLFDRLTRRPGKRETRRENRRVTSDTIFHDNRTGRSSCGRRLRRDGDADPRGLTDVHARGRRRHRPAHVADHEGDDVGGRGPHSHNRGQKRDESGTGARCAGVKTHSSGGRQ